MADLTVSGLIATGGVRSVVLTWANGPDACLPYLAWKGVEVWSATSNDRDLAVLVGTATGRANTFTHAGIAAGERWYWVRAIDVNDLPGPWHPADADAGVPATATDATPGPGSVTEEMLADGAVSKRTFVPGITPVEIGAAFPTEDNYVGRMFFRTTDSMLYRFDGTGFVATLPTGNLTGQIQAGQLAVNSVNANAIQAGAVIAGKISVANLAAISANLGVINAGTIYGALIATANDPTRVELSNTFNALRAFRSGAQVVTISGGQVGAGTPAYVHVIDNAGGGALISAVNTGAGVAMWAQSVGTAIQATTSGSGNAITGGAGAGVGVNGSASTGAGVRGIASLSGDGVSGTSAGGAGGRFTGVAGVLGNVTVSSNISVRADLNGVPGAGKMQAASYINFTGVHEELIDRAAEPEPGDIMVDTGSVFAADVVNATSVVAVSSRAGDRGAIGAFIERYRLGDVVPPALMERQDVPPGGVVRAALAPSFRHLPDQFDVAAIAAVGEGMVNVCGEGGDIAVGDLIVTSSHPGKGMRQADDIVRSITVAKAREAAQFGRDGEVQMVACIFLCG